MHRLDKCDPKIGFLIVYSTSMLASRGFEALTPLSINLAFQMKKLQYYFNFEGDDHDYEVYEDNYHEKIPIEFVHSCPLPSDSLSAITSLKPITDNKLLMESLDEDVRQILNSVIGS